MPLFDFKCPVCGVVDEVYVPGIHTPVYCENCAQDMDYTGDPYPPMEGETAVEMDRISFSSGSHATFDINTGYNANNGYGLRWPNNPSDLKLNPYI